MERSKGEKIKNLTSGEEGRRKKTRHGFKWNGEQKLVGSN